MLLLLLLLVSGLVVIGLQRSWPSDAVATPLRLRSAATYARFHAHQQQARMAALAADGGAGPLGRAAAAIAAASSSSSSFASASASAVGARSSSLIRADSLPFFFDPVTERTLVLYVFSNNDPLYIDNLRFFVQAAVRANDPADYVFVIQQDEQPDKRIDLADLPALPPNARYVEHANECLDWGTYAWLLSLPADDPRGIADLSIYRYFILMNCSVRGPFVPAYVERALPFDSALFSWTSLFTLPLRLYAPQLRYVGVSLQCIPGRREIEHVQSYLVAMDSEGLAVLRRSSAMKCHHNFDWAVLEGEVGATQAMLNAGFNVGIIASYAELLDYRVQEHCERHADILTAGVDGIPLDPLDLVFTKWRTTLRPYDSRFAAERVTRYDTWWRERRQRRDAWETNKTFALN